MPDPEQNISPYDQLPYESHPVAQANPSRLCAIARLFGIGAALPENASVLELGCAGGDNIISIAGMYPQSKCVGVEISEVQVALGLEKIKQSGLKNVELHRASIADIDAGYGKFDYIICHGVFSWVARDIQEKILAICRENLTPAGVAYVSYNTLPGWASALAAREMMKYHAGALAEPGTKAAQARTLLQFIRDGQGESGRLYSDMINHELELLSNQSDNYLLHEHLEEHNTPYYFHQFNEMAEKAGMRFLAESKLPTMFIGNFPKNTADVLATCGDIIRTEQYMDFIYNRRFRSTLLCHKGVSINRNIPTDILRGLYFTNNFKSTEHLFDYDYKTTRKFVLITDSNVTLETDDKLIIAMVAALTKFNKTPAMPEKITQAVVEIFESNQLKIKVDEKEILPLILNNLMRLLFTGGVELQADDVMATI